MAEYLSQREIRLRRREQIRDREEMDRQELEQRKKNEQQDKEIEEREMDVADELSLATDHQSAVDNVYATVDNISETSKLDLLLRDIDKLAELTTFSKKYFDEDFEISSQGEVRHSMDTHEPMQHDNKRENNLGSTREEMTQMGKTKEFRSAPYKGLDSDQSHWKYDLDPLTSSTPYYGHRTNAETERFTIEETEKRNDVKNDRREKLSNEQRNVRKESGQREADYYVDCWNVQDELVEEKQREKRRSELLNGKARIKREEEISKEKQRRKDKELQMQQNMLEKEIERERKEIHDRMLYEEKIEKEKELEYCKEIRKLEKEKENKDRLEREIEHERFEEMRREEKEKLKKEMKYRQLKEELELLEDIQALRLDTEDFNESSESDEEEAARVERLRLLRKEKEELQDRLKGRQRDRRVENRQPDAIRFNRSIGKPKLPPFDGSQFEEWKLEVTSLLETRLYNECVLSQVIRNSIAGKARKVLLTLKASATTREILKKMEDIYGNIRSGDAIVHDFYSAKQMKDEPCSEWGIRLETLFNQAVERGEIEESRKDTKLKERFWRGLTSEKIKIATRTAYESAASFDIIRKKARIEELEIESEHGSTKSSDSMEINNRTSSDKTSCQSIQGRTTDAKINILMKKIESIESSLEEIRKKDRHQEEPERMYNPNRGRYPQRYRGNISSRGYRRSEPWNNSRMRPQRDDNSASRWRARNEDRNRDNTLWTKTKNQDSRDSSNTDRKGLN